MKNTMAGAALIALVVMPTVGFADEVTNVTWKSSLSLGMTYKGGNTEKSLYTANLKGDRYAPKSDWINSLYGEHGRTEGTQTEGQLRGQSEYRYKFNGENLYGGVFSEGYHDVIKKIRARIKVGPNVGYYFINKEDVKFDASFGINYVYERTAEAEGDHAEYRAAANYLRDLTEKSSYYLNVEYTANVEDTDDGNGLLVTGVKSQVKDNLSMFVEARDEYDNTPDSSVERHNDVTVIAGLAYDFH